MSNDKHKEPEVVEHIVTVDGRGDPMIYTISRYFDDKRFPYRAQWKTGGECSSFGVNHQAKTLGQAQRILMSHHEGAGGAVLQWSSPRFDRRVTHERFGRGTLLSRQGDRLTIRFDDESCRDIVASFVTFDEEN